MKKCLETFVMLLVLLGLALPYKVEAAEKVAECISMSDGDIILEVSKVQKINDGVEVFLEVTNNRENTYRIDKDNFYLLNNKKQDYSLFESDANKKASIRPGAKNTVTLKFKGADINSSPFTLRGNLKSEDWNCDEWSVSLKNIK